MMGFLLQAMFEIHKLFGVNGNLKSSNCLVDSRWVVKVGDFGCQNLIEKTSKEERDEYVNMRGYISLFLSIYPIHLHY